MWNFKNVLIALFVVCLGGFIGFDPFTPSQTVGAEETRLRWVDVPKENFDILANNRKTVDVDLQDKTVSFSGDVDNTTVTIKTDVETRPVYKTKVIEKVVYLTEDIAYRTKLFNRLFPIDKLKPVINLVTVAEDKCNRN